MSNKKLIPSDGPRNMRCWLVKTPNGLEVVSAELARKEDEVYMFLDDSCAGDNNTPEEAATIISMRKQRGVFVQVRAGENYNGPFRTEAQANAWLEAL